jgi:hypothetical protein
LNFWLLAGTSFDGDDVKKSQGLSVIMCVSQGIYSGTSRRCYQYRMARGYLFKETAYHGEIFDPGVMGQPESMPQYQIGILDLQSESTLSVKWVVTARRCAD